MDKRFPSHPARVEMTMEAVVGSWLGSDREKAPGLSGRYGAKNGRETCLWGTGGGQNLLLSRKQEKAYRNFACKPLIFLARPA